MKRLLPVLPALCALAAAAYAQFTPPMLAESDLTTVDKGTFLIYQGDQLLGTEVWAVESSGDSLLVKSRSFQVIGADTVRKDVAQVLGAEYGLRNYMSKQVYQGHTLSRALILGDTSFMAYRQYDLRGAGDQLVLPPGRMFVMDPKAFICFDLICRSLKNATFEQRPILLLVLGPRDSVLQATATDRGIDTVRWGGREVASHRYRVGDARTSFDLWALPSGGLLNLEEPHSGLRIERQAEPLKRRAAPAPRPKPRPRPHAR